VVADITAPEPPETNTWSAVPIILAVVTDITAAPPKTCLVLLTTTGLLAVRFPDVIVG
jgi:hypothetical protein